MDENEVLIKIAADIADALRGFTEVTAQLAEVVKGVADVGKKSEDAEEQTKSLWDTFLEGVTNSVTASEAMGKQLSDSFNTLKKGVKDAAMAIPGMVTATAEAGDEMLTMSNRIGVSVENLSELKYIAGQSGASMEGMARTIQGLGGILSDTGEKGQKAQAGIRALGLSVDKLKADDPKKAFLDIIQAIQKTVPAAQQGQKAMEIFGSKFRNNTMLLSENIGELQEKFKELGGGMTTEMAKAGDAYADNMANIQQSSENFRNHLAMVFLPSVNAVLEKVPMLGGAVITIGKQFYETAKSLIPLVTNIYLMRTAQIAQAEATAAQGVAAAAATPPTLTFAGAMGTLSAAIAPVTLALGAAFVAYKVWEGAMKETGWIRDAADALQRYWMMQAGFTKAQADAYIVAGHEQDKRIAAKKAMDDQAEAAKKLADAQAAAAKALIVPLGFLNEEYAKVKKVLEDLKPEQKAQIKAWTDMGFSSAKMAQELAGPLHESVEIVTQALDVYKKKLEEAKKATEQTEFFKLKKDAKELADALADAKAAGEPMASTLERLGKKASDLVESARGMKGGLDAIPASITAIDTAWDKTQIATKFKDLDAKAKELSTTFGEKMTAAAKEATNATTAMDEQMRLSMMSTADARDARLRISRQNDLDAIQKKKDDLQKASDDELDLITKDTTARLKAAQDVVGAGQQISQATLGEIKETEAAARESAKTRTAVAMQELNQQGVLAKEHHQLLRDLEYGTTQDFEVNAKARGVKTQAMYATEIAEANKKLAWMREHRTELSGVDLKAYEAQVKKMNLIAANGAEARAIEHGTQTQAMLADEADAQYSWYSEMKAAGDTYTYAQIENQRKVWEAAEVAAGHAKVDWKGALQSITTSFEQLANISGGTFGGIMKSMGEVTGQANVMATSLSSAKDMFKQGGGLKGIGESFKGALGGSGAMGAIKGLMGGLGKIVPMAGAVIAGVTAAVQIGKKLWDKFTESQGEKAAKEVGKNFGVTITEAAGDAIAKTAKDLFKGDRFTAEIYSMKSIVDTAGGITEKNFSQMADRLGEVFHLIDDGKMTATQATKVLSENFSGFADHVIKTGKIATKQFTDIIKLQAQYGTQSKEITDFVAGQTQRLGTALGSLMAPMTKNVTAFTDAQKDAKEATEELQKAMDSGDDTTELQAKVDKLNKTLADTKTQLSAPEEIARFERLTVAGFNAAIKSGVGYLDAIESMAPALDTLVAAHEALGTKGSAAIQELLKFREVATQHKDLVESAGALNEVMLALSNTGSLSAEAMADLQTQGQETFTTLTEAGFTEGQSLQQMKGFLEGVRDAHKELGLPIDENTQKLITQAEQQGVLAKEEMSTNDIMMQGLGGIIEALGGKLPEAFKKMSKSATDAATEVGTSIDKHVTGAAKTASETLVATPWSGYASKGSLAAGIASEAIKKVDKSAKDVDNQLAATDWERWQKEAVDAATAASKAIDGVSLGHSPGGIKEIPIKIAEAIKSFRQFEQMGVGSAESVKDAVDALQMNKSSQVKAMTAARDSDSEGAARLDETLRAMQAQAANEVHINIDRPILKDREAIQELALEVTKNLKSAIHPSGAWK